MKKHTLKIMLLLLVVAPLLWQCGTEVSLYTWTRLDATNIDITTGRPLTTPDIKATSYGIELNLNPQFMDKVKSSKSPVSKERLYNDRLNGLTIVTLQPVIMINDKNTYDTLGSGGNLVPYFLGDTTYRGAMLVVDTLVKKAQDTRLNYAITDKVYLKLKNAVLQDASTQVVVTVKTTGNRSFTDTTLLVKWLK